MIFFTLNPNLKNKKKYFVLEEGGGRGRGRVARVSEFFLTKNPNLNIFFFFFLGGERRGEVGG